MERIAAVKQMLKKELEVCAVQLLPQHKGQTKCWHGAAHTQAIIKKYVELRKEKKSLASHFDVSRVCSSPACAFVIDIAPAFARSSPTSRLWLLRGKRTNWMLCWGT